MNQPMPIQGFKFHHAPIQWELAPVEGEVCSIAKLLTRFYDLFDFDDGDSGNYAYKPLLWLRDPEKEGQRIFGSTGNVAVAYYRKDYYIVIEKCFGAVHGPHAARLMYRSPACPGEPVWVAILQLEGLFHSDDAMQAALRKSLEQKELFQSEQTAETIVFL